MFTLVNLAILVLAIFIIASSVALSVFAIAALSAQSKRIARLESNLGNLTSGQDFFTRELESGSQAPVLENLKIAIEIVQDHELPVFANLLKERLLQEDAVPLLTPTSEADLTITGSITCNGYAEIYFGANLQCVSPRGTVLAITERPPQGARQSNLMNSLVKRLKDEVRTMAEREERSQALDQLK